MTRIALIGCGLWGRVILRTLKEMDDISVMVISTHEHTSVGCDGVIVATPSATHAAVALPYIERGIPTFIEKPMTTSVSDAERILRASRASGASLFIGHLQLYNPLFLKAAEMVPSLGTLTGIAVEEWNATPREDSSVLWDWLPHDLSMACTIIGRNPNSVIARWTDPTHQSARSVFHFGRVRLVSSVSWKSLDKRKTVSITGEKGLLFLDDVHKTLTYTDSTGRVTHPHFGDEHPLTLELRMFIDGLKMKGEILSHGEDGAAVVYMIAAAETSAEHDGREETIAYGSVVQDG